MKNIIEQIEEMFGDLSPATLINDGYVRVNGPDIGLNIKAGTSFITPNYDAIIVLGNAYPFLAALSEKQGSPFKSNDVMTTQMGSERISVYLNQSPIIAECIKYYSDVTIREIEAHEENPA